MASVPLCDVGKSGMSDEPKMPTVRHIRTILRRAGFELAETKGRWQTYGATRLTTRGYFVHKDGESIHVGWTPGFTPGQMAPTCGPGVRSGRMQKVVWLLRKHGYTVTGRGEIRTPLTAIGDI